MSEMFRKNKNIEKVLEEITSDKFRLILEILGQNFEQIYRSWKKFWNHFPET